MKGEKSVMKSKTYTYEELLEKLKEKYPSYKYRSKTTDRIILEEDTGKFIYVFYSIDNNKMYSIIEEQLSNEPFSIKCRPLN